MHARQPRQTGLELLNVVLVADMAYMRLKRSTGETATLPMYVAYAPWH